VLETKQVHAHLQALLATLDAAGGNAGVQSQLLMLHLVVQHDRRALLVYHNVRLDLLARQLARAASLPVLYARLPALRSALAPQELAWLARHAALTHSLKQDLLHQAPSLRIDITDPPEPLPTDLLVTVKANLDLNDLWLTDSQAAPTSFTKDQTITINRADVRPLITKGWVSIVHPHY
jgi:GINS complex subunit 1